MAVHSDNDELRQEIAKHLGFNIGRHVPSVDVLNRREESGYTRVSMEYTGREGQRVPALELVPHGAGPFPGVLVLHQHASRWDLGKSEVCGLAGDPFQAFGPALVRRGVYVLAPDAVAFEDRRSRGGVGEELAPPRIQDKNLGGDWLQHYNEMAYRIVLGATLMRQLLTDASDAISLMIARDGINPIRIGLVGHSFGGNTALFLGALDSRIGFTVSSGAACSYRAKMRAGTGLEMALIIPGFAKRFDVSDLVKCVAPRCILLVSSTEDPYAEDAGDIVEAARPSFEALNCPGHLAHIRMKGPHGLDRSRFDTIVNWTVSQACGV